MMTIRKFAALALVAISFAATAPVLATTLKRMSLPDLSRAAHTIVRARCASQTPHAGIQAKFGPSRPSMWKKSGKDRRPRRSQYVCSAASPGISRRQFPAYHDSRRAKNWCSFSSAPQLRIFRLSVGCRELSASDATVRLMRKSSRRTPPHLPFLIRRRSAMKPRVSAKCHSAHSTPWW